MPPLVYSTHFNPQLIDAFLGLQLGGGLGFSIIFWTALGSSNIKRNSTFYTFCIAWILSSLSYCLIFLVGQQDSPNFGVCVTQAAAIYSAPSLTSCGTLAFAIDMLLGLRAASTNMLPRRRYSITLALMIVPYLIWLFLFVGFLVFGLKNPAFVGKGPNGTYCDLLSFTPAKISGLIVVFATLPLLFIQGYVGFRLVRNRNYLKNFKLVQMAIRIMVFSLLGALGLGVGFAYVLYSKQGPVFDIIMAILPALGVIIFGVQMDLINVWLFRHPTEDNEVDDDLKTPSVYVATPRLEDLNPQNDGRQAGPSG
ncbi:hypothetical protein DFH07DRAFT_961862 [Mycena maculata]|uniref:Uncharacterized protein n=1 Tax=Mycena maculata TaxID=230809 RepID=A0AAD7IRJ0_9AGAR|nr:hypothetical protein DFH07DRAFT_961862 [Mycena maculata]